MDDENVLEISGELADREWQLADQIVVHRQIPVEDPEETDTTDPNPVPTSVNDTWVQRLVISFMMPNFSRRQ